MHSLNLLGVEMRLEEYCLAVSHKLFDFKATHHALNALILDRVMTCHLAHVVAELFLHICAHLSFLSCHIIEDKLDGAGNIGAELFPLHADGYLADVFSVFLEHFVNVVGRIRADKRFLLLSSLQKIELNECLLTTV